MNNLQQTVNTLLFNTLIEDVEIQKVNGFEMIEIEKLAEWLDYNSTSQLHDFRSLNVIELNNIMIFFTEEYQGRFKGLYSSVGFCMAVSITFNEWFIEKITESFNVELESIEKEYGKRASHFKALSVESIKEKIFKIKAVNNG